MLNYVITLNFYLFYILVMGTLLLHVSYNLATECVRTTCKTIIKTENRLPRLLLNERLGGLLSTACEREALGISALGMHFHDHHVCAHGPTVLTNPEHSENALFLVTQLVSMPSR